MKRLWIVAQGFFCCNSCWSEVVFPWWNISLVHIFGTWMSTTKKIFGGGNLHHKFQLAPSHTLPKTSTSPLNIGHIPKGKLIFQPLLSQLFRGKNFQKRQCLSQGKCFVSKVESSTTSHRENVSFSAVRAVSSRYDPILQGCAPYQLWGGLYLHL